MNTAFFVEKPRRLEDLQVLHPLEAELKALLLEDTDSGEDINDT